MCFGYVTQSLLLTSWIIDWSILAITENNSKAIYLLNNDLLFEQKFIADVS